MTALHDFGLDVSKMGPEQLVTLLQGRVQELLAEVKESKVWARIIPAAAAADS